MISSAELLERHPLAARLRSDQVQRLADTGELEMFDPGETVVAAGSPGDAMYLVLTGSVDVSRHGRVLANLPAGEFFGEMSLVEPAARSADVIAAERSFLFRLPNNALQRLLQEDPSAFSIVLTSIVKVLSERLRRTNETLSSVGQLADWLAGSLV